MAGINKVILVGRLGKDPEIKQLNKGGSCANLSLATSENWRDKNGQKQEKTEWHKIVIFGNLVAIAEQYLKKGSQVYLEGKIVTNKWQDQSGADKYTTEIHLSGFGSTLQMLDNRGNTMVEQSQVAITPTPLTPIEPVKLNAEFEDDIPF